MAVTWVLLSVLALVVAVGSVILVSYVKRSSAADLRERKYRKAVAALEVRKARANASRDVFEMHAVEQESILLRERYIAGKEIDDV